MPTCRSRPLTLSLGLLAISGAITGCGGSSSAGVQPSATAKPSTQIGQLSVLREPLSAAKAKAAAPKLKALPGVVQLRYAQTTHELLVYLSAHVTVEQRQRVVEAIARAANAPGTRK